MSEKITRDRLEASLRDWEDGTSEDLEKAKSVGVTAATAIGVAAVGVAYAMGRRRRKNEETVVEVKRVI